MSCRGSWAAQCAAARSPPTPSAAWNVGNGQALALRWSDVDLDAGRLRVRWQIDAETGERVEPKTITAKRDIVLMPALAKLLAAHRIASPYSGDDDPGFASAAGTPLLRS